MSKITINKEYSENLQVFTVSNGDITKYYITAHPESDEKPFSMFAKIAEVLEKHNAQVITQFVFGGCSFYEEGLKEIENQCGPILWPITWMQGDPCSGKHLNSTQVCAISGVELEPVMLDDEIVGITYEDPDAKFCLLSDLRPKDLSKSPEDQTTETFERMELALQTVGMSFDNVARTWLYLDNLLDWYDEFNVARSAFFDKHKVFDKMVPASTGIGVSNPFGAALVSDVLALEAKSDEVKIFAVPSPLQCAALDYKSSFSRAVEIDYKETRRLYISGTASIEPGGDTVHLDDSAKQIALTMEVVKGILDSRDMKWENTTRAIGYFKDDKDLPLFYKYCKENDIPELPMAIAHSDVCRHDLLFEIELDVIAIK